MILCCRTKLQRDKERDISEQIALGQAAPHPSQEAMFDQRLFNQNRVSCQWLGGVQDVMLDNR